MPGSLSMPWLSLSIRVLDCIAEEDAHEERDSEGGDERHCSQPASLPRCDRRSQTEGSDQSPEVEEALERLEIVVARREDRELRDPDRSADNRRSWAQRARLPSTGRA